MTPSKTSLIYDRREKPKELIEVVTRVVGDVTPGWLSSGDYTTASKVWGVERKRIGNLASSIAKKMKDGSKEFFNQLERCLQEYGRVYLVVEGLPVEATGDVRESVVEGRYRRVPYLSIQSAILWAQERGVRVVWTAGFTETALFLNYLVKGGHRVR